MARGNVQTLLLDVEPLWPCQFDGNIPFRSTVVWIRNEENRKILKYLPPSEQSKVLAFVRHTDAKLCLGSCLLKRRAISNACGVPWSDIVIGEDSNRKPCYVPKDPAGSRLEFNVSHHGSVVALVSCAGQDVKLGVDVVKLDWDRDYPKVLKEGFESWARTYEMVFSDREVQDIIEYSTCEASTTAEQIRAKLRHFSAHWCLKEAYVKMTGEALMAELRQVEFRNVRVPAASSTQLWGELCSNVEIWAHGKRVNDIALQIQAFREDYMISICASTKGVTTESPKMLDIEKDVYPELER